VGAQISGPMQNAKCKMTNEGRMIQRPFVIEH
jgi:hypothetical protein